MTTTARPATAGSTAIHHDNRPTLMDIQEDNFYTTTARANWLRTDGAKSRFSPPVLKQIFQALEKDMFSQKALLLLENLQYAERYLWPNYNEDSTDELILSLIMMIVVKKRESLPVWTIFETRKEEFPSFFRRVLIMSITNTVPLVPRTHLLIFISCAFQSLDCALVRKECAPLVSIGLWNNLHSDAFREKLLDAQPQFNKAWRAAAKKFTLADQKTQARIKFERSWLYLILLDFISILYSRSVTEESVLYVQRMIEFLTDLLSQLPTRRYARGLLEDLQIVPCIKLSKIYNMPESSLLRDLLALFEHFYYFEDDSDIMTGHSRTKPLKRHRDKLAELQRLALRVSKTKLMVFGLANHSSIATKEDLLQHLSLLNDEEISDLIKLLNYRQKYPENVPRVIDREFMLCSILENFIERVGPVEDVKEASILPDEKSLFSKTYLQNDDYTGSRPLALPKANLQYLSVIDFLWRMFHLYKAEAFFEIRLDLQETLRKIKPALHNDHSTKLSSILDVAPPRVGENLPAHVRAEIDLPLDTVNNDIRREWESLRPEDVVFLLSIRIPDGADSTRPNSEASLSAENIGIQLLRCAEVLQAPGDNKHIGNSYTNERKKLHVRLDRTTFMADKTFGGGQENVYESINLIVRRRGIENNFKSILTSIQSLIQDADESVPEWFKDTFLGYGDPAEACFPNLKPYPKCINFRDTFHDIDHLRKTLSVMPLELDIPSKILSPPFVLTEKKTQNRKLDTSKIGNLGQNMVYEVSNHGSEKYDPYPTQEPNQQTIVRYTPAQVNAIFSGTNPGISLIIGPPGTGKTDVATQIITNLYHNFPNERILVIAHSNQALNQIFQKIADRDIDERHLLRLGHGEEELQNQTSYSKHGRVESLIERRSHLLTEVDRLASSISAPGAHGNSCETAYYFHKVYVLPLIEEYRRAVSLSPTIDTALACFPFYGFFSNTKFPVLKDVPSFESAVLQTEGCFQYILQIFSELEDVMPFEILRNSRDRASYLLTKEARIIAMTSTHAAIKRDEIMKQEFQYDSVIMEEAAQVTEIETFIPLTLQSSRKGGNSLKRIVLCGDHLQNSPVIQNSAFRNFANLEQSLFARFVRLGVPAITLDQQGRARPSIAALYNWRYHELGNLDHVSVDMEFLRANAGFRHEFQFINVEDYKGHGEQEPSPHFIQNLGEAEYAVALFQYMRLLGYPGNKISILSSYAGQRALIRDIINHRCAKNPIFGLPAHVTTIDKFQGEQNDYIILSLVRTNRVGYLRDIRRLTVALSRARLGLYILGRMKLFEMCYELKEAFSRLLSNPTKLELITGEMWPTSRVLASSPEGTVMEGLEHIGQYVFEMTQAKLASIKDN